MMLVHMEVHLKGYLLMSISLQKYTVCGVKAGVKWGVKAGSNFIEFS